MAYVVEFVHETLTWEQQTDTLSPTKLNCHNKTNQQKVCDVDQSLNKSCWQLILFIDVEVVHCLELKLMKWGLGMTIWHSMVWEDIEEETNGVQIGNMPVKWSAICTITLPLWQESLFRVLSVEEMSGLMALGIMTELAVHYKISCRTLLFVVIKIAIHRNNVWFLSTMHLSSITFVG